MLAEKLAYIIDGLNRKFLFHTGIAEKSRLKIDRAPDFSVINNIQFPQELPAYLSHKYFPNFITIQNYFDENDKFEKGEDKKANPTEIAYFALYAFDVYLNNDSSEHLTIFNTQFDKLLELGVLKDESYLFQFLEDEAKWNLKAPWYSALTQSLAGSVFLRKYIKTNENKYLELADLCLNKLTKEVENGGLLRVENNQDYWLEEYPSAKLNVVLNGHISAVIGLLEYSIVSNNWKYKTIINQTLETLIRNIDAFKFGNKHWFYCLNDGRLCNQQYKALCAFQFLHLWKLTGITLFKNEALNVANNTVNWKLFAHQINCKFELLDNQLIAHELK